MHYQKQATMFSSTAGLQGVKQVERKNYKLSNLVQGKFSLNNFINSVAKCHVSFHIRLILKSNGLRAYTYKNDRQTGKNSFFLAVSKLEVATLYIPGSCKVHVTYSYRKLER